MSTRLCSRIFYISNPDLKVKLEVPIPSKQFMQLCVRRPMKYSGRLKIAKNIDDIKKHFKQDSYYKIISGIIYFYDNRWLKSCIQFPT